MLDPSAIGSLVGPNGYFHADDFKRRVLQGRVDLGELRAELRAQIQVVLDMGIRISHVDSHKNEHLLPRYFGSFVRVAQEFGITRMRTHRHAIGLDSPHPFRARWSYYLRTPRVAVTHLYTSLRMWQAARSGMRMPDRLIGIGYGTGNNKGKVDAWLAILRNLPRGLNELYCHPGYVDEALIRFSRITANREETLRVLTSDSFRSALAASDIELVSFWEV